MRHDEATLRQFWEEDRARQSPARFPVARQPAPAAPVAAQQPAPPQQLAAQQAFNASLQRRAQAEAQRAAAPQAAAQQAAHTAAAQPRAQKASGGGAPAIDAAKVPAMTVKALKEELGGRGLAVGGKKGELVARLTEALDAAAANPISAVLRGTPG